MNKLLVINAEEVISLLPMEECILCMERAMVAASKGEVAIPPRLIMPLIDNSAYFGLMPGSSAAPQVYGAKVVSLHPGNPSRGLPAIQGFVTLFDHQTGVPTAIVEGSQLTAIRTAAASGMATKWLAREDARSHGILGTGVQAAVHIDAVQAVRNIEEIIVWGHTPGKATAFVEFHSKRTGLSIRATESAREAAACDIVSTVTSATEPVLMGEWVKPGAHLNLVGAHSPDTREVDAGTIARARVYVDLHDSAMNEAGDLLIAIEEGAITEADLIGEIGNVISGSVVGRTSDDQITIYESLGITAQDLYAAHHAFLAALEKGIGKSVAL